MPDSNPLESDVGFKPYAPRRVRFEGLREARRHWLKLYSIVYGGGDLDHGRFAEGLRMAVDQLPSEPSDGRPGLAFAILHQGQTGDYVVICWWDHENELPTRVFLKDDTGWRPATTESFCVWDLEVMWFERLAYVSTILTRGGGSIKRYLEHTMN